jgi:hypothetical protein
MLFHAASQSHLAISSACELWSGHIHVGATRGLISPSRLMCIFFFTSTLLFDTQIFPDSDMHVRLLFYVFIYLLMICFHVVGSRLLAVGK